MSGTNADVIINGVKARLAPVEGRYKRRTVRREIQQQLLTQSETPVLRNRDDGVALYQTSWAGGARWWKPLLTSQDLTSYFQASHMDVWSEPGKVVPMNKVTAASHSLDNRTVVAEGGNALYGIGDTNNVNSGFHDVYKWTPASDAFVQETGYHSGVATTAGYLPHAMVYDPSDGYFYVLTHKTASTYELNRFNPATTSQNAAWVAFAGYIGGNIFLQQQELMFYNGDTLFTVDKSGPSVTEVYDDGLGKDVLQGGTFSGAPRFKENVKLAISTSSGIYYVKNTRQGGQAVAWVFRVDKDISGAWVGSPIATLPVGSVALDITEHLGQIIVSTSPDAAALAKNNATDAEVVLYFVGEGGMGALGSVLGGRDEMDETPWALLASRGTLLYIGGNKRLWVYDAVRGGLHTVFEFANDLADGPRVEMVNVQDSDGDSVLAFLGSSRIDTYKIETVDDPDTVAAFGDDEAHYTLESNYFDGGLPMEEKEITRVAIFRDKDDGGSEWTVQISADDGAFADVLTDSGTSVFKEASLSGTTGYQFRYKLIYQTKDTARKALRALLVEMATGDMITEWDLMLDGSELLNLDGTRQDPETFYDNMVTLSDRDNITTIIDNYQEGTRSQDAAGAGTNVKVVAVEIMKDTPGESVVRVLLREA